MKIMSTGVKNLKVRQISLSIDPKSKNQQIDQVVNYFLEKANQTFFELASEEVEVKGVRLLETNIVDDKVIIKLDDPANLTDHILMSLNEDDPNTKVEVFHTAFRH